MKIRQGFVSNSSTTSFCIYGASFDTNPFTLDYIKNFKKNDPKEFEVMITELEKVSWMKSVVDILKNIDNMTDDELQDANMEWGEFVPYNLDYHPYHDAGMHYIGRSWSRIGDDETGKAFKASIEKDIEALFGKTPCSTHAEAWRDG